MSDVQKKMGLGGGVLLLILLVCCCVQGCQQYGTVSPKAYEVATALYSTCNRRDIARLETVDQLISQSAAAGDLTDSEQQWFEEMVSAARSGDWETPMMNARTMMNEQVDR